MIKRLRARRGERGAVAIVVAVAMVALMAAAAVGVDIARLVYERQQLQNALDAAAAAAAQQLPDHSLQAIIDAETFTSNNLAAAGIDMPDPGRFSIALRCVVAYNTKTNSPDWTTVSTLCGISSKYYDPLSCNEEICSVPCTTSDRCNTIVIKADKDVAYMFGPAINFPTGKTGTIVSAACRGFCGRAITNPMDVVVMADRTPSMASDDVSDMKTGIKAMLGTMTREQQYIAFGAIHKSTTDGTCLTGVPRGYTSSVYSTNTSSTKVFSGSWVPQKFSNTYTTGDRDLGTLAVNTSDSLYKAIDCLKEYDDLRSYTTNSSQAKSDPDTYTTDKNYAYPANTWYGTHLASALKGAARYLYGYDSNNLSSLPSRTQYGKVQKVIIFETDGRPEEIFTSTSTALSLSNNYDIGNTTGESACTNLKSVATAIKALSDPPLIITIGYGNAASFTCSKTTKTTSNPLGNVSGSTAVKTVLASVASNENSTTPSKADQDCTTEAGIKAENTDGDYFFCASDGTDLASVFVTAMGSIKGHGRLMALPGVQNFTFGS